jgi:hypothetical protein
LETKRFGENENQKEPIKNLPPERRFANKKCPMSLYTPFLKNTGSAPGIMQKCIISLAKITIIA